MVYLIENALSLWSVTSLLVVSQYMSCGTKISGLARGHTKAECGTGIDQAGGMLSVDMLLRRLVEVSVYQKSTGVVLHGRA